MIDVAESLPCRLVGDGRRLCSVVQNFASNAIKFSRAGSTVTLRMRLDDSTSRSPSLASSKYVLKVEVCDEGVGINAEDQSKLFEAFSQIRPGDLQDGRGSGLGLAIAKQIIKLHGGKIGVVSEPNQGSIFYFVVPLNFVKDDPSAVHPLCSLHIPEATTEATTEARAAPEEKGGQASPAARRRALVVDDVATNRKMLAMLLKKRGFECTLAEDGEDAVTKYEIDAAAFKDKPGGFDMICMDAVMPKMDGLEATRQIRKAGFKGPILGCTGNALAEDVAAYIEAGANTVLTKPISLAHLDIQIAREHAGSYVTG